MASCELILLLKSSLLDYIGQGWMRTAVAGRLACSFSDNAESGEKVGSTSRTTLLMLLGISGC